MSVRVKLCGMTRAEDLRLAAALGADYVGFVLWPGSPRAVTAEGVARLTDGLPVPPLRVGVFVDERPDRIAAVVRAAALHLVQLHGDEPASVVEAIPVPTIRAVRMSGPESLRPFVDHPADYLLLDAHVPGRPGGTGREFAWAWARDLARPYFLAGGLGPDNVARAASLDPFAVDLSSGVETAPGVKDPGRMRAVLRALGRTV